MMWKPHSRLTFAGRAPNALARWAYGAIGNVRQQHRGPHLGERLSTMNRSTNGETSSVTQSPSGSPASQSQPQWQNTINGPALGPTIQAGAINGDVHLHLPHPATVVTYECGDQAPPLMSRVSRFALSLVLRFVLSRMSRFVWGWVVALFPVLLVCAVVGAGADRTIGEGSALFYRTTELGCLSFVILMLWLWSAVTGRSFRNAAGRFMDRCTPRRLAALPSSGLLAIAPIAAVLWLSALVQSMSLSPGDPDVQGSSGARLFFCAVGVLATHQVIQRRRTPQQ